METTMSKHEYPWRSLAVVACLSLLVACKSHDIYITAEPNQHFMMMTSTSGNVLATPAGMTLYTYDKDVRGKSTCYGNCALTWPPLLGDSRSRPAGNLTLVARKDGTKQWAFDGKPLYTFVQDKKPGQVKGDGFNNVWHVVRIK
jgi:predicted lipoprotein with Yx(FWY)xxD motif